MELVLLLFSDVAVMSLYPDGVSLGVAGSNEVSMVAETVTIRHTSYECASFMASVEACFILRCNSDKPVNLVAGFPFQGFNWGEERQDFSPETLATRMKLSVMADGKPVDFDCRTTPLAPDTTTWFACWPMKFKPGQSIRVLVSYTVPWSGREHNFHYPQPMDGKYGSYSYSGEFTYIVSTGATWAGTIGDALISVELPSECMGDIGIFPKGYATSKKGHSTWVTWHYSDWEPDSSGDIRLGIDTQREY